MRLHASLARFLALAALTLGAASAQDADPRPEFRADPRDRQFPGTSIVHGDIAVPPQYFADAGFSVNFWPNKIVWYRFHANVTPTNRQLAIDAMSEWEAVSDVSFLPFDGSTTYYMEIRDGGGNSAGIGWPGPGSSTIPRVNVVYIHDWTYRFVIAHELGHVLGLWHEQSRPDRDAYVVINWNLIESGAGHNFDIESAAHAFGPYDFDSVMHYGPCFFSICCSSGVPGCCIPSCYTIAPTPAYFDQLGAMGQQDHLSAMDARTMSFMYPESNWRFLDPSSIAAPIDGSFLRPYVTLSSAISGAPTSGTLWLAPTTYTAVGVYSKAMTWEAQYGSVLLR